MTKDQFLEFAGKLYDMVSAGPVTLDFSNHPMAKTAVVQAVVVRSRAEVRQAVKDGKCNPQKFYKPLLLRVLSESPNRALTRQEAHKQVEKLIRQLGGKLQDMDKELVARKKCATPRWMKAVDWCYNQLKKENICDKNAPRGVWSLI